MVVDHEKLISGLKTRIFWAELALRLNPQPSRQRPQKGCVSSQALFDIISTVRTASSNASLFTRICLRFRTAADQLRFVDQIGESVDSSKARVLAIGSLFIARDLSEISFTDSDYSIAATNAVVTSENASEFLAEQLRILRPFQRKIGLSKVPNASSLRRFVSKFGLEVQRISGLSTLSNSIYSLKRLYWPILGPDLLTVLQSICDPAHEFSKSQLENALKLARLWRLETVLLKLVVIRALGGYLAETEFIKDNSPLLKELPFSGPLPDLKTVISGGEEGHLRFTPLHRGDLLDKLISFFAAIAIATTERDLSTVKRTILDVHELDPSSVLLLNWKKIHASFALPASEADVSTVFIKSLMMHPTIGKRFPIVAVARGRGQMVADLSSLLHRIRTSDTRPTSRRTTIDRTNAIFIQRLKQLPKKARDKLMLEVLDKGMMERIAFALPTTLPMKSVDGRKVDNQASVLRIELANIAKKQRVLSSVQAEKIVEDEAQQLRLYRFSKIFQQGRVQLDWDHLQYSIVSIIEQQFDFLFSAELAKTIKAPLFRNVAVLIAEEITDILLFDSESSLEQALSNNLRHGVFVPRFVKEYTGTLSSAFGSTEVEHYGPELGSKVYRLHASTLEDLRSEITSLLTSFMNYWLKVDRKGEYFGEVRELVVSSLQEQQKNKADSFQLAETIVGKFQQSVDKVLGQIRREFVDQLKPDLMAAIAKTRITCSDTPSAVITSFLDSLETNINAACDEVAGWLGIAKFESGSMNDFNLLEVIQFETFSLISSDFKKLRISSRSFRTIDGSPRRMNTEYTFNGDCFEPVTEIVHNLISNAYKHSGLSLATDIVFEAIIDGEDLLFRCKNSFSEKRVDQMLSNRTKAYKRSLHREPDQAKLEADSGFEKIKNVCSRVFGVDAIISVPPIAARTRQFLVEVLLKGQAATAVKR